MLHVSQLTKSYLGRPVVSQISFEIGAGDIAGLLGLNGAGKTTIMRMITGVLEPDAGLVTCQGRAMWPDRIAAQSAIGYLPEGAPLYGDMTPYDYLDFIAGARGLNASARAQRVTQAAERLDVVKDLHWPIETLSKGFRRRVALAGAIMTDPAILVLDEPTDGLDLHQKRATRALIKALSPGRAILISTHLLDEIEAVCNRVLVLANGAIVADTTPAELARISPTGRLEDAFFECTQTAGLDVDAPE